MGDPHQPRDKDGRWSGGLVDSLEHQLRTKGHAPVAAHQLAIEILTERGHLDKAGRLTPEGLKREAMGRQGRRVDRMAQQTGHHPKHIGYKAGRAYVK